jgi:peptide/nickel transport system permease protein
MYMTKRAIILIFTLFVAITINFFLPRVVPGDPMGAMIAMQQGRMDPGTVEALRAAYGIDTDRPIMLQYVDYLGRLAQGDLGRSTSSFPASVSAVIWQAAPWTLGLVGITTILSFLIGSFFGLYSAWRRGTWLADTLPPVALFLNSMPYFWVALLFLFTFSFTLQWFPLSGGQKNFIDPWTWDWFKSIAWHGFLPAISILITSAGGWLITMRNNAITVMGEDYVALARAKGLPDGVILRRYVLRNALLPSLTAFGMALGFVLAGSLLTEIVFSYPGLGYWLFLSVASLDYPLMQGIFLFIAAAVLIINFLVDALYVVLDPRVRNTRTV